MPKALLAEGGLGSAYTKVDIESDLDLVSRYGDQIPVPVQRRHR